jgi:hypothetical protein
MHVCEASCTQVLSQDPDVVSQQDARELHTVDAHWPLLDASALPTVMMSCSPVAFPA